MKKALKNTYRILFVATSSLFALTAVATKIAMENVSVINKQLHVDTMKVIPNKGYLYRYRVLQIQIYQTRRRHRKWPQGRPKGRRRRSGPP